MVQCFFYYQVVDPFQASSDFNAPVIPTTPCCLQQACLQFICSQIIWHSISLSSWCWIIFVELSGLVAKNAYILVQKVNWLWTSRSTASRRTELRASASSLQLCVFSSTFSAFDVWADFLVISTKLLYISFLHFMWYLSFPSFWASFTRSTTVAFLTASACFKKVE